MVDEPRLVRLAHRGEDGGESELVLNVDRRGGGGRCGGIVEVELLLLFEGFELLGREGEVERYLEVEEDEAEGGPRSG